MPAAKVFQIDTEKPWRKRLRPLSEELWERDFDEDYGIKVLWHWEAGKLTKNERQRTEAEGLIVIQVDECVVPSQSKNEGKDVWVYTGVMNAGGRAYYFTAESGAKLFYQVGALLAVLEVHKGMRDVLVLGDGARWIRKWYQKLPIARKEMRLCWFHLTQTCHDHLTAAFGYTVGLWLEGKCLRHLWRGEVMAGVNAIEARSSEVVNKPKYRRLIRYLKARLPMIPNYQQCRAQGQWVANTGVEVFNDWAVARERWRQ